MSTFTVGASTISQPFKVERGSILTVTPNTATVTYYVGPESAVRNGVATFTTLPLINGSLLVTDSMWVKVAAVTATTVVIDADPSTAALRTWIDDYSGAASATNPQLRIVATNCAVADTADTSNKATMSRTVHELRAPVKFIKLVFWFGYVNSATSVESGYSNPVQFRASIESSAGTFRRATWNGDAQLSATNNLIAISDFIPVDDIEGAEIAVRAWQQGVDGTFRSSYAPRGNLIQAASTTPDLTMGGSIASNTGYGFAPIAIIGYTDRLAYALVGDSIVAASGDGSVGTNTERNTGYMGRAVGPNYAFTNLGISGERGELARSNYAKRGQIIRDYCTNVWGEYGVNDILGSGGLTGAQMITSTATFYAMSYFTGKRIYQSTLTPRSTGTFADDAGQTAHASSAEALAYNVALRNGGVMRAQRIIDVNGLVLSATKAGVWTTRDGVAITDDGTHPNKRGHLYIASNIYV